MHVCASKYAGEQQASLLECIDVAYRLVLAEGVRSGIIATCQELSLWPPPPNPHVEADDSWLLAHPSKPCRPYSGQMGTS